MKKILVRVKLRIYSRLGEELPLYHNGAYIEAGTNITIGDETEGMLGKKKVKIHELQHQGRPSGYFILSSDLDSEYSQVEQRQGVAKGRLRTSAAY